MREIIIVQTIRERRKEAEWRGNEEGNDLSMEHGVQGVRKGGEIDC